MSYDIVAYEDVHQVPPPRDVIEGEVVGEEPELVLPWDVDNRIRRVDAAVTAIDRRLRAARRQLGAEYIGGWKRFVDRWRHFHRTHQRLLLHAHQGVFRWSDIHERVLEYELRVAQWRRVAEARGVHFPLPAVTVRPRGAAVGAGGDTARDAKPLAVAAAVGLSALAVIAVVNKLS